MSLTFSGSIFGNKSLNSNHRMRNMYANANFVKILEVCKIFKKSIE